VNCDLINNSNSTVIKFGTCNISLLYQLLLQYHIIKVFIFKRNIHHYISVMELGHLLTRSGLTYPEISSKVCHDSLCQLGNGVSLHWVIISGTFYLRVISSFSHIPVICLNPILNTKTSLPDMFI
jgi:hypothetical protein